MFAGRVLLSLSDEGVSAAATLLRGARTALGESAMLRHDARPPMPMDYYLRSEALLCARERTGSSSGFFVSLCGGANLPAVTPTRAIWRCTATASRCCRPGRDRVRPRANPDERAALWETQSQYHNLPVINNQPSRWGAQFQAIEPIWELAPERSRATLDISRAYPDEAGVLTWQRTVALMRNERPCVRLWEIAEFKGDSNDIEYNFITTHRPYLGRNTVELGNVVMSWRPRASSNATCRSCRRASPAPTTPRGCMANGCSRCAGARCSAWCSRSAPRAAVRRELHVHAQVKRIIGGAA